MRGDSRGRAGRQPCQLCRAEEHPSRISRSHSLWWEPASGHFHSSFLVENSLSPWKLVGISKQLRALGNSVWKFQCCALCGWYLSVSWHPGKVCPFKDRKFCWIIFFGYFLWWAFFCNSQYLNLKFSRLSFQYFSSFFFFFFFALHLDIDTFLPLLLSCF